MKTIRLATTLVVVVQLVTGLNLACSSHAQEPVKVTAEPLCLNISVLPMDEPNHETKHPEGDERFPLERQYSRGTEMLLRMTFPEGLYPARNSSVNGNWSGNSKLTKFVDSNGKDLMPLVYEHETFAWRKYGRPSSFNGSLKPGTAYVVILTDKYPSHGATYVAGEVTIPCYNGRVVTEKWRPLGSQGKFKKGSDVWFGYQILQHGFKIENDGSGPAWVSIKGLDKKGNEVFFWPNMPHGRSISLSNRELPVEFEITYLEGTQQDITVPFRVDLGIGEAAETLAETTSKNP